MESASFGVRFLLLFAALALASSTAHADEPEAVPYADGDEKPPGYHLEQRARSGPISAGIILGSVAYSLAVFTLVYPDTSRWVAVPVVGPFVVASRSSARWNDLDHLDAGGLMWMNGALQATAAVAIVSGLVFRKTWWVRDERVVWAIAPIASAGTRGLSFVASF